MNPSRLSLWLCLLALPSTLAWAQDVNTTRFGNVAIKGHDPVAYFKDSKPVKGSKEFEYEWNGAKWRFSSQEYLEAFKASPETYAPQFGGYCAWAVSQGYKANIDPTQWTVVEGKLYLNYNKKIQKQWLGDRDNLIRKGEENWPSVQKK